MLGGEKNLEYTSFAFTWDMVATCFWASRNRYFGQLVGKGKTPSEAYDILKSEKKHAEWYETLKGIWEKILANKNLKYFWEIVKIFLHKKN
jgi:glycerol-3-phosphate dehydrogenase